MPPGISRIWDYFLYAASAGRPERNPPITMRMGPTDQPNFPSARLTPAIEKEKPAFLEQNMHTKTIKRMVERIVRSPASAATGFMSFMFKNLASATEANDTSARIIVI